jgi:hypothetical protein
VCGAERCALRKARTRETRAVWGACGECFWYMLRGVSWTECIARAVCVCVQSSWCSWCVLVILAPKIAIIWISARCSISESVSAIVSHFVGDHGGGGHMHAVLQNPSGWTG